MIKVGQIYYHRRIESNIVITYTDNDNGLCDWVVDNGKVCTDKIDWIRQVCDFVAEYPTWQEAVNSKEFKE